MKDPYGVLGIVPQASDKEIKAAYRKLVKKYHPDVIKDNLELTEKMYEIQEAYAVIGDPEKRKAYDEGTDKAKQRKGQKNKESMGAAPNPDMTQFERFFGFQPGKGRETYQAKESGTKESGGPINPDDLFARYFGKTKK